MFFFKFFIRHIVSKSRFVSNISFNATFSTESPKKHETWKTTRGLLINILIRMKGPSIETNTDKITVTLTFLNLNI